MLGKEDEVICFSNRKEMTVKKALLKIKKRYKLHSLSNLYLVEDQYRNKVKKHLLAHAKTYICKRKESKDRTVREKNKKCTFVT